MEALRPSDPRQVGQYAVLGRLGCGGFGEVFLGRSPGGRRVAVKLIRADRAGAADFRARFRREVASAQRVNGAFTAPVISADPDAERPWLVTEFVDGPSLEQAVWPAGPDGAAHPLPADEVLALAAGLAEGIAVIHAADVIHRDLKPSNVILSGNGPRIIDFGISRDLDGTSLTDADQVVGTPAFMSPEQASGRTVGKPSDMFSLASVLTFTATGTGPFGRGEPAVLLYRIAHESPELGGVPRQLRPLLERCLDKDPGRRPTAEQFLAEVSAFDIPAAAATLVTARTGYTLTEPDVEPVRPARRRLTAAVVVIAVLAVAVAGSVLGHVLASGTAARAPTAPRSPGGPAAVVRAYVSAINAHAYRRAWRLGGDHLATTYRSFVAGYRHTRSITILWLNASGDVVYLRTRAPETSGLVQTYAYTYVVVNGVIVTGQQTLLRTSS